MRTDDNTTYVKNLMESMKFMLVLSIFLLSITLYSTSVKHIRINTFVHQEAWVETKTKATRDRGRDGQKDRQTDIYFMQTKYLCVLIHI